LKCGGGDGHGQFVAFAVDIEVQAAGAIIIKVAETIGDVFIGEVEDIAEVGVVPEGKVEGDIEMSIEGGDMSVEDMVRCSLREQAILGFELQALGMGMEDRKA
jgi:hypothetical protein